MLDDLSQLFDDIGWNSRIVNTGFVDATEPSLESLIDSSGVFGSIEFAADELDGSLEVAR